MEHIVSDSVLISCTDGDPSNYLTYFKRAAVYLAMGQVKKAIPDLTSCITLKPDFQPVSYNDIIMIPLNQTTSSLYMMYTYTRRLS